MGTVEPSLEELLEQKKRVRNPSCSSWCTYDYRGPHCWVSQFQARQFTIGSDVNESKGGCSGGYSGTHSWHSMLLRCGNPWKSSALMTAGVLTAGLISFRQGNSKLGQMFMRARVVVQGATVALMVGAACYYGGNLWKSS